RRRREAELNGGREIIEYVSPFALVIGAATMALVHDNEIEEIRRIFAVVVLAVSMGVRTAHESLEDREKDARILRHAAFLADVIRLDAGKRIFRKIGEFVVGLIGEDIAVGQEQDARAACR